MMTVALIDADFDDLTYELNDGELVNDVLMIVGDAGSEVLIRGYSEPSIDKYGRRSYRIDRPIVDNTVPANETPQDQATIMLDRYVEPYAMLEATLLSRTDALTAKILSLKISDLVIVTEAVMSLSAAYYIVDGIDLDIDLNLRITATIKLVQARANEHP